MTDIGISCAKDSYGRGWGKPLKCKVDEESSAGLCYKNCASGFKGSGPVCWGSCPEHAPHLCGGRTGVLCLEYADECTVTVAKMVVNVLMLVAKTVKLFAEPEEMAKKVLDTAMNGFDVAEQIFNAAEAFNFPICKNHDNVLKTLPKYWSDDR